MGTDGAGDVDEKEVEVDKPKPMSLHEVLVKIESFKRNPVLAKNLFEKHTHTARAHSVQILDPTFVSLTEDDHRKLYRGLADAIKPQAGFLEKSSTLSDSRSTTSACNWRWRAR